MFATLAEANPAISARTNPQRLAQQAWVRVGVAARLRILRKARASLAAKASQLVDAIPSHLSRTRADSYVAELLPLLAACKFLEKQAPSILKPRRLGASGRPFWLAGVDTTIERVPFGLVLIIAPSNYPLFLAGVQTLQALAAGNAVVWKPGSGGRAVAQLFASALYDAGLSQDLLKVTDEAAAAGIAAIHDRPDKIIFTGSSESGRAVLRAAAEYAIPVVAELSGCDAVLVLPSADESLVLDALVFGMRLNGSSTCMAPRRLMLVGEGHEGLLLKLRARFSELEGVGIPAPTRKRLESLLRSAEAEGAVVYGDYVAELIRPILVEDGDAGMAIAQADIFAPVLTVLRARDIDAAVRMDMLCTLGLAAAIFGRADEARQLGRRLNVGTVTINDLIVPTADPRVPFGGRRGSGFGVTRGAEGLLAMTEARVTAVRRPATARQYEATYERHERLFAGVVAMGHAGSLRGKVCGLATMLSAAASFRGRHEDTRGER